MPRTTTRLRDKHGAELFEFDVVEFPLWDDKVMRTMLFYVPYRQMMTDVYYEELRESRAGIGDHYQPSGEYYARCGTKLGNYWDNPKLFTRQ